MSDTRLADLSDVEFDVLIEGHIEHVALGAAELPAEVFVDVLFEHLAIQPSSPTQAIDILDDQSVISSTERSKDQ